MRQLLAEIRDGSFAESWIAENASGRPRFSALRAREAGHELERVGRGLREKMKRGEGGKRKAVNGS
jgi:ketol-acid reductoisomerase